MLLWILTTYLGRRTIYLWGSAINCGFLITLGIAGSVGISNSASLAQAFLGLIVSVFSCLGPAPASWVIIGEMSAIRLRPLTTGIGRASYYIMEIPCIFLASYMLNPTGGNRKSNQHFCFGNLLRWYCWRQVRLRLGCYCIPLPRHSILPNS